MRAGAHRAWEAARAVKGDAAAARAADVEAAESLAAAGAAAAAAASRATADPSSLSTGALPASEADLPRWSYGASAHPRR